ncbi:TPA: hypothetical protein I9Y23_001273 [Kluyvera ascorbata]|uniref:Uncharacterized protein n=1 Tax=Kluyvera genomosp. 2 TaxID=2774054 RepID=A0A2T2Y735_9ENTR|nr:hypothetical protein [Kluyvera genomosp. 2]PSR48346.1 hypothetical protein C8256_04235 [Kluyvera genomosp. 2]HAT3917661.1 hypothetical protein [Kluyvera ascorbata]HAT3942574.1 hypothetical protein [Kluyvera ascorbata]HAT3946938.1 hypothetical protein [Kluyvera ascorbata]
MARYAVIENSIVINLIEWDGESKYDAQSAVQVIPAADGADIGSIYNGTGFVSKMVDVVEKEE